MALDMLCQEMHEAWKLGDAEACFHGRVLSSHRGRVTTKERDVVRGNN